MLSEETIIEKLKSLYPEFIGDDAALIPLNQEESYTITKDLLVEDVHFKTTYFSPEDLAHKALHVNLSDLAAMGSLPQFVLMGISIPESKQTYGQEFIHAFAKVCQESKVILIGGDTTRSPDKLYLSVTAIGKSSTKQIKYRKTAKSGDLICIAGTLGESHLGFISLEQSLNGFEKYKKAFLQPAARIKEGIWLGEQPGITAMMDISDGLYIDLKRLCAASNVEGMIDLDQLTPSPQFIDACNTMNLDPLQVQLCGGEDYGLLCTIALSEYDAIAHEFSNQFGYPLNHIGYIKEGRRVSFIEGGIQKNIHLSPFTHFGEKL